MAPEPEDPSHPEPAPESEPEGAENDAAEEASEPRKKLPAGWAPARGDRKKPVPVFVDEPDPSVTPSLFADKRYELFRKQMVWAAIVIVAFAGALSILFLFFPHPFAEEQETISSLPSPPPDAPESPPTPEQQREREREATRARLQSALAARAWMQIDAEARAVLAFAPDDGEAWHALGWVQERNGDLDGALAAYGKAIDAQFLPSHTHLKRASIHRAKGHFAEAIRDLEASIRLDPSGTVAPNLLLITRLQNGDTPAVRRTIGTFESSGVVANADQFLLAKAALALQDGDPAAAARALTALRASIPPALFATLMQDRFFDPYRTEPELQAFLIAP